MSSFLYLTEILTCRYNDKLRNICKSWLSSFNINHFWYHKITNSGYFSCIDSHPDWMAYSASEKLYLDSPYLSDLKFQYGQESVNLLRSSRNISLEKMLNSGRLKFNFNLTLVLTNKTSDGIERFGFSSENDDDLQTALFINQLPCFYLFVKKFREENRVIFSKIDCNLINLIDLVGPKYYENPLPIPLQQSSIKQNFLEKLGIKASLSMRDKEVIEGLLKGYSASQIAKQAYISKRTAEHRIERLKQKLSCFSKSELIQKAQELQSFDYFLFNSYRQRSKQGSV